MKGNIDYIGNTLAHHQKDFIQYLRRGDMIEKLALKNRKAPRHQR
jgi:hypothetical protein